MAAARQKPERRNTPQNGFKGSAGEENNQAERAECARCYRTSSRPQQRSEYQCAADGGHGAAEIAVHPEAVDSELHAGEARADERPAYSQRLAQCPAESAEHHSHFQPHSPPWMSRKNLSCREKYTLR